MQQKETYAMISTIRGNFKRYTDREVKDAKLLKDIQRTISYSFNKTFKDMMSQRLILNALITIQDIIDIKLIFGHLLGKIRRGRFGINQLECVVNTSVPSFE